MKPLCFLLFATYAFFSCGSSKRHVEGAFTGLHEKIIVQGPMTKDTRIMVVHGTGEKELTYADTFVNRFIIALSGKKAHQFNNRQFPKDCPDVIIPLTDGGTIIVRKYKIGDETIRFYIVHWSDITHPYKQYLYDNETDLAQYHKPASLNKNCKKEIMLVNLSDFVLYSGDLRHTIRKPVEKCMQLMFIKEDEIASFEGIQDDPGKIDKLFDKDNTTDRDVYLFNWSLGSRIALDVLSNNKQDTLAYQCNSEVCDFFYKHLRGIYMMSHQAPLLSTRYLAKRPFPNGVNNIDELYQYQNYFGICNFIMNNKYARPIDFVAFSDPNDLLGYKFVKGKPFCRCQKKINPQDCNECGAEDKINKVVYSVNNTGQFLKWVANPGAAHRGAYTNNMLIKLLVRGCNQKGDLGPKSK